ncbi:group III truncated hemoglobin [Joostella sp. CR20]|uniref:group III truncated hemoglobin n=1 Tax=Joostella sp. CR20 TaxID=2804312 RepID=UPI00313B6540
MKKDISTLDDIKLLVNIFYGKVREDELLKDIFNDVIQDKWDVHLEKMYRFWETVLLDNHTYYGGPFAPHAKLPVAKEHFDRWKLLFSETLNENFEGEKANEAKWRAEKMAEMFLYKITYLRTQRQS